MPLIVSFCGSPTYQLSKHLTSILKPLTDEFRRKLLPTDNSIDAMKTVKIPDYHKLVSFHFKTLNFHQHVNFNLPLIVLRPPSRNHSTNHHYPQTTLWTYCTFFLLLQPTCSKTANTTSTNMEQLWASLFLLLGLK